MQLTERTTYTHTQPFNGILSGTTRVGWYQKKHSLIYTHADHQTSFINFLHLLWSIASSLLNLRAWQSFPQPLSKSSLVFLFVLDPLFILHVFLHSIIVFLQHVPILSQAILV